jgi:hypothetical protein
VAVAEVEAEGTVAEEAATAAVSAAAGTWGVGSVVAAIWVAVSAEVDSTAVDLPVLIWGACRAEDSAAPAWEGCRAEHFVVGPPEEWVALASADWEVLAHFVVVPEEPARSVPEAQGVWEAAEWVDHFWAVIQPAARARAWRVEAAVASAARLLPDMAD